MTNVTVSLRMNEELKYAIDQHARTTGETSTRVITAAVEEYLYDRYHPKERMYSYSTPDEFDELPEERKNELVTYLKGRFAPSDTMYPGSSYGMKHGRTNAAVGYVTNGQFKGAMLAAGFKPVFLHEENWRFNVKEWRPEPKGIYLFIMGKAKTGSGDVKLFAGDMRDDKRLFGVTTIKELVTELRHISGIPGNAPVCSVARRILKEYGTAHPEEVKELVDWVSDNHLYYLLEELIPVAWRAGIQKPKHYMDDIARSAMGYDK